jgi:hypothetical protein
MKPIAENELRALYRYQKCSVAIERFVILEASASASNKLLVHLEESFTGHTLRAVDYHFLSLLSEKRAKNYKKLSDIRETVMLFSLMKDAAFKLLELGNLA